MAAHVVACIANGREESEWDYAISNLSPDGVTYCLGSYQPTHNPFRDAPRIDSLAELPTGIPKVVIAPFTSRNHAPSVSLVDFVHPEDAIYIFGPNNEHLEAAEVDHVVVIPTDTKDEMFNYMSYLVTMWDRRHG